MDFLSIITIVGLFYLIYLIIDIKKRNKKNKGYIQCIEAIEEESQIFTLIDTYIEKVNDVEFITKAKIIKLYAAVFHKKKESYDILLNDINLDNLMNNKKGDIDLKKLALNEDSFYYFYFLITFTLYKQKEIDTLKKVNQMIEENHPFVDDQMFDVLYQAFKTVFFKEEVSTKVFESLIDGSYQARYAKQMIALYKKTGMCMYAYILKKQEKEDKIKSIQSDINEFSYSRLGKKVIGLLNLEEFVEKEDEDEVISE